MNHSVGSTRRTAALQVLEQLEAGAPDKVAQNLDEVAPELVEIVLGFAFADVLSRPDLDLASREMCTVAALTAMGTASGQLEFHIRAAMNVGVTKEQIIEIILQMAVYAGVPACMNGIAAAKRAFAIVDNKTQA
ncbi:carboxymuconolactone decarboxylase family protein [Sulfitobacter sp. F26204]|uniref:carboxymuconolactone decarboxylase family protein n=1 Tax=Sulfitobacter sp. F26204 TaxID=2996014 RepID=UPI00225E4D6B|nr:carboxymuconolactone decarboxylase family protein [Sulfitobacter sp. F26204]MCX7560709.1 carboxymuconolactone decarboxylase family protein [Sulfitobacter sp. F26204]